MTINTVSAHDVLPEPWRNGGGRTRELLAWPAAQDWALRVSVADISADGPFSAFDGVERWFAVIEGSGVTLHFADGERRVTPHDVPLRFDGAAAPDCGLINGPTRDLNLMLRLGEGVMRGALPGTEWEEAFAWRGLFSAVAGRWLGEGTSRMLDAHTLLWSDTSRGARWRFEPEELSTAPRGWWLGYTPRGVRR
jgi:environmental stress-induced protein Ves